LRTVINQTICNFHSSCMLLCRTWHTCASDLWPEKLNTRYRGIRGSCVIRSVTQGLCHKSFHPISHAGGTVRVLDLSHHLVLCLLLPAGTWVHKGLYQFHHLIQRRTWPMWASVLIYSIVHTLLP
jgi:hypothetical protein